MDVRIVNRFHPASHHNIVIIFAFGLRGKANLSPPDPAAIPISSIYFHKCLHLLYVYQQAYIEQYLTHKSISKAVSNQCIDIPHSNRFTRHPSSGCEGSARAVSEAIILLIHCLNLLLFPHTYLQHHLHQFIILISNKDPPSCNMGDALIPPIMGQLPSPSPHHSTSTSDRQFACTPFFIPPATITSKVPLRLRGGAGGRPRRQAASSSRRLEVPVVSRLKTRSYRASPLTDLDKLKIEETAVKS